MDTNQFKNGDFNPDFGFKIPIERDFFKDITPIVQSQTFDPPGLPCSIKYSSRFDEVMSIFRALRVRQERSRRMLGIAGEAVFLNAANYTAWKERRNCMSFLLSEAETLPEKTDLLLRELSFTDRIVSELSCYKNYQVWQHRKVVSQLLGEASQELNSSLQALSRDAKNYHAWSHRQWALSFLISKEKEQKEGRDFSINEPTSYFSLLDAELAFTEELLGMKRNDESTSVEIMEVDSTENPTVYRDDGHEEHVVEEDEDNEDEEDEVSGFVDIFNNSAWNHRFFCLFILGEKVGLFNTFSIIIDEDKEVQRKKMMMKSVTSSITSETDKSSSSSTTSSSPTTAITTSSLPVLLQQEVQFANRALQRSPRNESAKSYLRGLEAIQSRLI